MKMFGRASDSSVSPRESSGYAKRYHLDYGQAQLIGIILCFVRTS